MISKSVSAGVLLALAATQALAANVVMYRAGEAPSPRDVASILSKGRLAPTPPGKTRSIRMILDDPRPELAQLAHADVDEPEAKPSRPPAKGAAAPAAKSGDDAAALALMVNFAFDSAQIPAAMFGQLDAVAAGIKLAPGARVVIEGHTDAIGTAEYNLRLSAARAEAVRAYLVTRHAIEPARLRVVGMGEFAPLSGREPAAAEQRRVQFRAEG